MIFINKLDNSEIQCQPKLGFFGKKRTFDRKIFEFKINDLIRNR